MPDTNDLERELTAFVTNAFAGLWARFCPEGRLPQFIAGHRTFPGTRSALLQVLTSMHRAGIDQAGDTTTPTMLARELRRIRGSDCKTWWSLYVAEALRALGTPFDANPVARECDQAQRNELRQACDTTHVIDKERGELIGHPNNYWLVVARCEAARLALELTDDRTIFDLAINQSRQVLARNPLGYMDDSEQGHGRYDVYAGHGLAAAYQLPSLGDLFEPLARAWERLVLAAAREDGLSLAWGRSGGVSATLDALRSGAQILARGVASQPERLAGLCRRRAEALMQHWWKDDAIAMHRSRRPHWYFGPGRIIELSLLFLDSLCQAALALRQCPSITCQTDERILHPEQDLFVQFDERGPGVWCYRNGKLRFQWPLTDGFTSDYVAAPVWPGLFEQVCDRGYPTGVPVVEMHGKRWLPLSRPEQVEHRPGGLTWQTNCWTHKVDWDWWKGSEDCPGTRRVDARVEDGWLVVDEQWTFETVPDAVGMWFAESLTPIDVRWHCEHPYQSSTMIVEGMADWRSHDHIIRKLHQIDITPSTEMRLSYRLRSG